ncbi:hypothetical protein [Tuwongella immobilis]|uniref:hypothetical protein n=1 Tax=Tuwongella immobilis TaxID=692036 RepID=UPI0013A6C9E1|nr:hypothetical protein [Tuwongella immobilis]
MIAVDAIAAILPHLAENPAAPGFHRWMRARRHVQESAMPLPRLYRGSARGRQR